MVSLEKKHTESTPGPTPLSPTSQVCLQTLLPSGTIPHTWVLHHTDSIEQLCEKGVHLDVDRNEFPQCICSLQAHAPVGVLQGFGKGGLKLGQEGLQGNSNLWEKPHSRVTIVVY